MNLIITGSCGHIGSYIAENVHKIKKIKKTFLIDNLKSERLNSLFNQRKRNNLNFHMLDLNDQNSLSKFKNVKYVIHCASMTNAEKSFERKKEMYRNNLNCFNTVVKFCKKNKAKLIHLSSTSVYGKQSEIVDENCEKKFLKPQSPYAHIKLLEEDILRKNNKHLAFNTFRLGTITGVSTGMRFHTAVNKFCFNASINKKVEVYKTALNQFRPYLSLNDAFKVFNFCITNNFFKNDIFNILSGNFTVKQILNKINRRKRIRIKFVKSAIMNQLSYHVSKDKIQSHGLILNSNISKDIKETLNLLKNL